VRGERLVGIDPAVAALEGEAGDLQADDAGELLLGDAFAELDEAHAGTAVDALVARVGLDRDIPPRGGEEGLQLLRPHVEHLGETAAQLALFGGETFLAGGELQRLDLLGQRPGVDREGDVGLAGGEQVAAGVEDVAAARGVDHDATPRLLDLREVVFALEDVQLDEAAGHDAEAGDDEARDEVEAKILGEAAGVHRLNAARLLPG
jgi:hypothetical protein